MSYRMLIVILILALVALAGCRQTEPFTDEELDAFGGGQEAMDRLTYIISANQFWITPNPDGRWSFVGRQLQVTSNITTVIQIRLEPKVEVNQPFEEALDSITAEPYTLEETDDGMVYARGTSAVSDHVIWRNYPEYVVELILFDSVVDTVAPQYIEDWEVIALEGGLFTDD